jgi:hypothetical protein
VIKAGESGPNGMTTVRTDVQIEERKLKKDSGRLTPNRALKLKRCINHSTNLIGIKIESKFGHKTNKIKSCDSWLVGT